MNLQIDAYLPNEYISDQRQNWEFTNKFVNSAADYEYLQDELIDRFWRIPRCCGLPTWGSFSGLLGSFVKLVEENNKSDSEI